MGVQEEEAGDKGAPALAVVVKGKRSKRQRVHAAVVITAAESSSSVAAPDDDGWRSGADEAASGCVTEEEEDMALCLMLLARGGRAGSSPAATTKEAKFRSRRPADGASGEFVYECKTCSKCFPSFQALGGHRTSHKKPRLALTPPPPPPPPPPPTTTTTSDDPTVEPPPPPPAPSAEAAPAAVIPVTVSPKQEVAAETSISSKQLPRVHECSICGAEFASGQALGGHMRRHRPLVPASTVDDGSTRKEKSLLELDLNMPAPCDDAATTDTTTSFAAAFAVKERSAMLFPASASALVDCHY